MSWRPASRIGLGGGPLGNLYAPLSDAMAEGALQAAWDGGIRHFDTAPFYGSGLAELRLGRFLAGRPRDSFTLSTKVGRVLEPEPEGQGIDATFPGRLPFVPRFDYSHDGVMRSFEASLQRLGVDRVDLLLLHDVDTVTHGVAQRACMHLAMRSGLRAMQALREAGVVRAIGLGVNECAVCLEAMRHADWDCFMVAGRYTLLQQEALDELLPACARRGIGALAAGIFNSGILATGAATDGRWDYQPAPPDIVARAGRYRGGLHPAWCEAGHCGAAFSSRPLGVDTIWRAGWCGSVSGHIGSVVWRTVAQRLGGPYRPSQMVRRSDHLGNVGYLVLSLLLRAAFWAMGQASFVRRCLSTAI
jgi:D-threo-aldose 1-dehydrogenase